MDMRKILVSFYTQAEDFDSHHYMMLCQLNHCWMQVNYVVTKCGWLCQQETTVIIGYMMCYHATINNLRLGPEFLKES